MQIARNTVVAMDYTLTNDEGEVLDTSEGRGLLEYLHGAGNIIPGLEAALEGQTVGASLKVTVAPAEAYGEHDPSKMQAVPRSALPPGMDVQVGMQLMARGPDGQSIPLWVVQVEDQGILVDGNHPLAGETLHFAVEIRAIRAASSEEVAHGHPHGPDGHGHDHGH